MRRMTLAFIMMKPAGIVHSHNLIRTQGNDIGPMRPMTPPPISPVKGIHTFRSRPEVIEFLREEINQLSKSRESPVHSHVSRYFF